MQCKQVNKYNKTYLTKINYSSYEYQTPGRQSADSAHTGRRSDNGRHYHPRFSKGKTLKGEVLAVGNGTKDEEMVLKAGDKVLYGKYAGTEIELAGEKYLIMRQSDVLAVIND